MPMNNKSALAVLLSCNWVIGIFIELVEARGIGDYWLKRAYLIREENRISFGGDIPLTENEMLTNYTLMSAKVKEIDEGSLNFLILLKKISSFFLIISN